MNLFCVQVQIYARVRSNDPLSPPPIRPSSTFDTVRPVLVIRTTRAHTLYRTRAPHSNIYCENGWGCTSAVKVYADNFARYPSYIRWDTYTSRCPTFACANVNHWMHESVGGDLSVRLKRIRSEHGYSVQSGRICRSLSFKGRISYAFLV